MNPDEYSDGERKRQVLLRAVEGYADLGLFEMAWEEFRRLEEPQRNCAEVMEVELVLYMRENRWAEAVAAGRRLCNEAPDRPGAFILTAYCLHESGATDEALRTLRGGPEVLQQEALFHYNCACYLAVLGDLAAARKALVAAFALDENLEQFALQDPDLAALHLGGPGE